MEKQSSTVAIIYAILFGGVSIEKSMNLNIGTMKTVDQEREGQARG